MPESNPKSRARSVFSAGITVVLLLMSPPVFAGSSQAGSSQNWPENAPPLASDFHSMKGVNGKRRSTAHQGIDLSGPNGFPVLAAADGAVLETETDSCWGPTIVIDHGVGKDGKPLIAAYGHLGRMLVRAGDKVRRGQVIARLGDNQNDFKCIYGVRHLHFQLGRQHRSGDKGTWWGHVRYLVDGETGVDPHQYWADGPNRATCFSSGRAYPAGTLTLPASCARETPTVPLQASENSESQESGAGTASKSKGNGSGGMLPRAGAIPSR